MEVINKCKSDIEKIRQQYFEEKIKKNTALRIIDRMPDIALTLLGYADFIELKDIVIAEITAIEKERNNDNE